MFTYRPNVMIRLGYANFTSLSTAVYRAGASSFSLNRIVFHYNFHSQEIGNVYVVNAGYLEVAEANDIIVLFPQAVSTAISNPNGCFDWWGYHDNNFEQKTGGQMSAIYDMAKRLGL